MFFNDLYLTVIESEAILKPVVNYLNKTNYINAVKSGFVLIFSATLFSTLAQQFLDRKIERIIQSPTGLNSMIWIWGFLSLVAALLFPLIQSILCSFYLSQKNLKLKSVQGFVADHLELSLIESLRCWGKSFLWFFVFVLPGFVKYSYYMFSPFFVLFSKKYKSGEADALLISESFFKRYWIYTSVQLTIFYFILPMVLSTVLDQYRSFYFHPASAVVSIVFETLMILLFHLLILNKIFIFLNTEKDLYADV